jgi:hypothetical protein
MNNINKDTLIKILVIIIIVLGYLYFFNNDCEELKKEIEGMENAKCEGTVSGGVGIGMSCGGFTDEDTCSSKPGCTFVKEEETVDNSDGGTGNTEENNGILEYGDYPQDFQNSSLGCINDISFDEAYNRCKGAGEGECNGFFSYAGIGSSSGRNCFKKGVDPNKSSKKSSAPNSHFQMIDYTSEGSTNDETTAEEQGNNGEEVPNDETTAEEQGNNGEEVPNDQANAEREAKLLEGARCIPNHLLFSCDRWNENVDNTLGSCYRKKTKEECVKAKAKDYNPDGETLPVIAGSNPSVCEFTNRCEVEYQRWKNDPMRFGNINEEEAELSKIELLDKNSEDDVEDDVEVDGVEADGVEADGVEADGVEADGVKADGVEAEDVDPKRTNADSISSGISEVGAAFNDEDLRIIGSNLADALKKNDNSAAILETTILLARLKHLQSHQNSSDAKILSKKDKVRELLSQIKSLNDELQKEGQMLDALNAATIADETDRNELESYRNFMEGYTGTDKQNKFLEGFLGYEHGGRF